MFISPFEELTIDKKMTSFFVKKKFLCCANMSTEKLSHIHVHQLAALDSFFLWCLSIKLDWHQIVCLWWSVSIVVLAFFFFAQFTYVAVGYKCERNENSD